MMIGIGTPSNHSKIPRPIFVSSEPVSHQRTRSDATGSFGVHNYDAESCLAGVSRWSDNEHSGKLPGAHQCPVFGIEVHGSAGGFASPFCKSSIECRSGERTNAICPSRGGRLMVMPSFIRRSQVA